MKKFTTLLTLLAILLAFSLNAQVAINNDGTDATSGALLHVKVSNTNHPLFIDATSGAVSINDITPAVGDVFSSTATGTNWAINGYSVNAPAVFGLSNGTGPGLYGYANGNGDGIYGVANKSISTAIKGINFHNAPADSSVVAISGAAGMVGTSTTSISLLDQQSAVIGTGNGPGGIGIVGFLWDGSTSADEVTGYFSADFDGNINTDDGPVVRIAGYSNSNSAQFGIQAFVPDQDDNTIGVLGVYTGGGNYDAYGVFGDATSANNGYGYGIRGDGNYVGVRGFGGDYGVRGTGYYGVYGYSSSIFGWAVYANGDMGASGVKPFCIDYPLDPENKYLKHFSVESDEVLLQYRGVETFDIKGEVMVKLPEYYNAINKNASYQLTPIGASMPNLYIKRKVDESNTFEIAGGIPGKEVSWLVISERNDPYLKQNSGKRKNVVDKEEKNRGKYLMPQLYGQSEENRIGWRPEKKRENIEIGKKAVLTTTEIKNLDKVRIDQEK
jgi:hypothetical protein